MNTIEPDGAGGFITSSASGKTSHRFYCDALAHMRSLGLAQATSTQSAQRGQVEEWVPESVKTQAASGPTGHHPRAAICIKCQTPFIWEKEPRQTCGYCPDSRIASVGGVFLSSKIGSEIPPGPIPEPAPSPMPEPHIGFFERRMDPEPALHPRTTKCGKCGTLFVWSGAGSALCGECDPSHGEPDLDFNASF